MRAGVAAAGLVGAALIGALLFLFARTRRRKTAADAPAMLAPNKSGAPLLQHVAWQSTEGSALLKTALCTVPCRTGMPHCPNQEPLSICGRCCSPPPANLLPTFLQMSLCRPSWPYMKGSDACACCRDVGAAGAAAPVRRLGEPAVGRSLRVGQQRGRRGARRPGRLAAPGGQRGRPRGAERARGEPVGGWARLPAERAAQREVGDRPGRDRHRAAPRRQPVGAGRGRQRLGER